MQIRPELHKKGIIMKKQIIISSVFAFLTTSAGLLTLPGTASAERQDYRDDRSSRPTKKQPPSDQKRRESERKAIQKKYEYDYRNRRFIRDHPDYKPRDYNRYRPRPPARPQPPARPTPPVRSRPIDRDRRVRTPHRVIINQPRHSYRGYVILPPYRHYYPRRYRPIYRDRNNIWAWIAITAITLKILDNLNQEQQRAHERAIYGAISVPIGNTVTWTQGAATGTVTPIWEGRSNTGEYCREFRQEITIGNRTEVAHGTACQRPDGSWEIVD
jgi:surface antigen